MKKELIGIFLIILMVVGLVCVDTAVAKPIELKFAHFMSPMHIQHQKSFAPFCKKVEELTGGKVKIKIYPGGTLGKPKQLPDSVIQGITDIAFIIPSYTTARFPRTSAFDLPFLFDSATHATKAIYDVYDKYLADDYKDYKVLWFYSGGPGHFQSVTKPIHTLDDLKGMKMRTPSAYMSKFFKIVGANPVGMPISKLTMSLQKKVIDGMLAPWSVITDFRLFDLVKYLSEARVYISPMAVVMNKEKWASLPEYAKKAIDEASGRQWGLHASKIYDVHDINTIKANDKNKKITVYKFPEAELQKFKDKVKVMEFDWIKAMTKKGLPAAEIMQAVHDSAKKHK